MARVFILICLSFFLFSSVQAEGDKINEFVITLFDRSVKVTAPARFQENVVIVIENKTLRNVVGKIQTESGRLITLLSVEMNNFKKINAAVKKGEHLYFIPLSPAFQEAELIFGRETYEIPPKH